MTTYWFLKKIYPRSPWKEGLFYSVWKLFKKSHSTDLSKMWQILLKVSCWMEELLEIKTKPKRRENSFNETFTVNTVGWAKERTLDDFLEINVFETEPKKPWLDAGRVVSSAAWKSLLGFNAESYCTSWSSPWFGKKKAIACACAWDDVNFLASATIIVEIPHSISFKWDPNQDYYPSFLQSEKKTIFLTVFEIHSKSLLVLTKFYKGSEGIQLFDPFVFGWLCQSSPIQRLTFTKTRPKFLQNMDDFPRFERVIIKRCAFFSGDKSVELFFLWHDAGFLGYLKENHKHSKGKVLL